MNISMLPLEDPFYRIRRGLRLYGKDISVLKNQVIKYVSFFSAKFDGTRHTDLHLRLGEVNYFANQLCGDRFRGTIFRDLSGLNVPNESHVEGIVCAAPLEDGRQCYCVILSKEYEKIARGEFEEPKTPKEEEKIRDAYKHYKLVLLHEICHLILQESGSHQAGLPLIPLDDIESHGEKNVQLFVELAKIAAHQYVRFDELTCYLLTYVLAFWPLSDFMNRVNRGFTPDGWETFDIRSSLAGHFNMPVRDAAIWLVILFGECFNAHYVYRRESDGLIVDAYAHDKAKNVEDLEKLYFDPERIACKVATRQVDLKTPNLKDVDEYVCLGAFEPKNECLNKVAETIVVGFSLKKIRESLK